MDDDSILLKVAADSMSFRQSLDEMRAAMSEDLVSAADTAGRGIETALRKAARNGSVAFEDLARVAARALGEMTASALVSGQGGGIGRLDSVLGNMATGLLGLAGRATGGPVSPGQAYIVGERGPEVFVPTSSGRVETGLSSRGPVNLTVNMSGGRDTSREFMSQTARQVARNVRRALDRAGA